MVAMAPIVKVVDLFCGAGGASLGARLAIEAMGLQMDLTGINHWDIAIATHSQNFPGQRHLCAAVERIKPRQAVPGRRLHLLIGAPPCPHHSRARGGVPVTENGRAHAWEIITWAREIDIDYIVVENVPDFMSWGPLRQKRDKKTGELLFCPKTGDPLMEADPERKTMYFRQFVRMLRDLGYEVEWRVLNCAHYGDPTSRERFFLQAKKRGRITWPKETHLPPKEQEVLKDRSVWLTARSIIDWTDSGESIFRRKKPLCDATMKRIFSGFAKFNGPFIYYGYKGKDGISLDVPLPTITASWEHLGVVQPYLVGVGGPRSRHKATSLDMPLPTILGQNHTGVCQPYLIRYHGGKQGEKRAQSIDAPLTTLDTSNRFGLCQPYLVTYYGNGGSVSVEDPLDTVLTRDTFGLVQPQFAPLPEGIRVEDLADKGESVYGLDILFRMLKPEELARAHSFPDSYVLSGSRADQVKQIGNSWPVNTARALILEVLGGGR